jgi:transcriptional regulator with XRE-family HTH domain
MIDRKCRIKDHEGTIGAFFDWIGPHVDAREGDELGVWDYENDYGGKIVYRAGKLVMDRGWSRDDVLADRFFGPLPGDPSDDPDLSAVAPAVLGERLRAAREYLGFTVYEAADFLHTEPQYLQMFESGRKTPDMNDFLQMAKLYDRTPAWFVAAPSEPKLPEAVEALAAGASPEDRAELARFADYLEQRAAVRGS